MLGDVLQGSYPRTSGSLRCVFTPTKPPLGLFPNEMPWVQSLVLVSQLPTCYLDIPFSRPTWRHGVRRFHKPGVNGATRLVGRQKVPK
jgi:hypothetical protein